MFKKSNDHNNLTHNHQQLRRIMLITVLLLGCVALSTLSAGAQSSLGIGSNEVSLSPTGPFATIFYWINSQQRSFYLAMTTALKAMREDPWQASWLVLLSFLYGILHAAGPGHGKAVISSYMIANETALRRGISLSLVSSILQAFSALLIVGLAWFVLRGTGISMGLTSHYLELFSYFLLILCGIYIFSRKLRFLLLKQRKNHASGNNISNCPTSSLSNQVGTAAPRTNRLNYRPAHISSDSAATMQQILSNSDNLCPSCGHSHLADPAELSGDFNWKTAWAAILAVGLRPCSGAIIVFTFALMNGLIIGGILSVFAMALGTFITVAALATLAVTAKNTALKLAKNPLMSIRIQTAVELTAAGFIILIGILLFVAALTG